MLKNLKVIYYFILYESFRMTHNLYTCTYSGDQDIRDATMEKANYLAQIGDKDEAMKVFSTGKPNRL